MRIEFRQTIVCESTLKISFRPVKLIVRDVPNLVRLH